MNKNQHIRGGQAAFGQGLADVKSGRLEYVFVLFDEFFTIHTALILMSKSSPIRAMDYYKKMKSFYWDCCRITQTIARDGIVTAYNEWPSNPADSEVVYLSQGQLPGADGNHPAHYTHTDAIGREIESASYVADPQFGYHFGYAEQVTKTAYPFGTDNFSVTTDPLGICTTNITTWSNATNITVTSRAGITTTTEFIAGGAKITTQSWTDSVSGENLMKVEKSEVEILDNSWKKTTSSVKYDDGEWLIQSETVSDFLGRVVATLTPLGTTSNYYDSTTGRLTRVSRAGSPDVLYFYDELGEQTETCVDINSNGAVDYSGPDQITTRSTYYQEISNDWWQVSSSAVYFQTNSTSTITTSVSRVRMTGFGIDTYNGGILTAQSESEDWHGNITRSSTYTDAANATTWQVTDTPDSNINAVQKSVAGYPVQTVSATSVTNTFSYDGFARQVTATDGRTNTSFTAYNNLGQVAYVEDAVTNRTSFFYNGLGQRIAISNALGQTSHTAYNQLGQSIATWGTSYPVAYQFDAAGRMIALATTRSNAYANVNLLTLIPQGEHLSSLRTQNSALDLTQWFYEESTGLVTNKVYADGKGTAYTYTDTGRMLTRTWARGITTTYEYNVLGQLLNIRYSGSTPNVTFTHDRLGRILSATSTTSINIFEYSGLALAKEAQDSYIIERIYDTLGRSIGYELYSPDDLINPVQTIICGYSSNGRLSSVSSVRSAVTNTFTYTFLPGTDLISGFTNSAGFSNLREYEENRNLITTITNAWKSFVISSSDYINDPLGRRTKRFDCFNSLLSTNVFGYNIFGEVIEASMSNGTDNYNIDYDSIGNRKLSIVYSGQSAVTNTYAANKLNQYTAIDSGLSAFPTHDTDGNLTWDGQQWAHLWDAENRLIASAPNYWGTTNGAIRIDYTYDLPT